MGGTVLNALTIFAGLNWHGEALRLNPGLPDGWKRLGFNFDFKGDRYHFDITGEEVKIYFQSDAGSPGRIFVKGIKYELESRRTFVVRI